MNGAGEARFGVMLAVLTGVAAVYTLSQTTIIPALPSVQHDLRTTTAWSTWVVTGFLLVASVASPLMGKLGDQYGKRRLLVWSLIAYAVGCAGSAVAPNIGALVVFRAVQGASGAIFPLSFSLIRDEAPPGKAGFGIGLVSAVYGIGGGLGILLAGLVIDNLGWRSVFVIGAAVAAAGSVALVRLVPESPVRNDVPLDLPGAALLSLALVTILLALTEGGTWGWAAPAVIALFAASAAATISWIAVELRVRYPLVDMRVLVRRPVLLTNACTVVAGFAMFGSFVVVPRFAEMPRGLPPSIGQTLHYGFGLSVTVVGLYFLPSTVTVLVAGPLAGRLGSRIGMRWPLAIGLLIIGATCASLAAWHAAAWQFALAIAVQNIGTGFVGAAVPVLIAQSVRPTETGVATGMNSVMRIIGSIIGAQTAAALLGAYTVAGTTVPAVRGYVLTFAVTAVAALGGAALAVFVSGRTEEEAASVLRARLGSGV
jgi:EmrB/QacA subfamily drug resistance transporter